MLVLSRKIGESIVIDGVITVHVLDCSHGRVRLGIEAPPDVDILRHELAVRIAAGIATCGEAPCQD